MKRKRNRAMREPSRDRFEGDRSSQFQRDRQPPHHWNEPTLRVSSRSRFESDREGYSEFQRDPHPTNWNEPWYQEGREGYHADGYESGSFHERSDERYGRERNYGPERSSGERGREEERHFDRRENSPKREGREERQEGYGRDPREWTHKHMHHPDRYEEHRYERGPREETRGRERPINRPEWDREERPSMKRESRPARKKTAAKKTIRSRSAPKKARSAKRASKVKSRNRKAA